MISGALTGAAVSIDGTSHGTIAHDGSFSTQLEPGRHTIALSRDTFRPRKLEREFSAGQTVRLGIEDVALEQIITLGVPDTPMPAWGDRMAKEEIQAIVGFIRSWEPTAPAMAEPVRGRGRGRGGPPR